MYVHAQTFEKYRRKTTFRSSTSHSRRCTGGKTPVQTLYQKRVCSKKPQVSGLFERSGGIHFAKEVVALTPCLAFRPKEIAPLWRPTSELNAMSCASSIDILFMIAWVTPHKTVFECRPPPADQVVRIRVWCSSLLMEGRGGDTRERCAGQET